MQNIMDKNDHILGCFVTIDEVPSNSVLWFTPIASSVQVGAFAKKDHVFPAHKHINHPRTTQTTNECLIILEGELKLTLWDENKEFVYSGLHGKGDIITLYSGYHEVVVQDGCKFVEVKNGPFTSVEDDKIYL